MKRLSYFLYDEKDNNELSKGYLNAIIGVITISTLLYIAYFLYNNTLHPPIGGTSLNSSEKMDAFVEFVSGFISGGLTKTGQVVKTTKKGLQGFNQFVKRTPGITTTEGLPLRTHYIIKKDPSGNITGGAGPRMITPINTPTLPLYPMISKPARLLK